MSNVYIGGTLILQGDLLCDGTVNIQADGTVIPVLNELNEIVFSCPTQDYVSQNGKSPTIKSLTANTDPSVGSIQIYGIINGNGQGFPANFGPGANSTLYALNTEILASQYGATHAGLGSITSIPGSIQVVEEQFTINSLQFSQEFIVLQYDPMDDIVALNVIGGTSQKQGIDFDCSGGIISWEGYALEPLIDIGDILRVIYLADTARLYPSPKKTYGSYKAPTSIGSGSGEASGGCGIKLEAPYGLVHLSDARITMNGSDGLTTRTGGGSGGSVWIKSYSINVDKATIAADGGSASYEFAGGGAGGYITFSYEKDGTFSDVSLSAKGKHGSGNGIVYTSADQPILMDKFTGNVLNSKWWTVDGTVNINNTAEIPTSDSSSLLRSNFSVSGNSLKVDIDHTSTALFDSSTYLKLYSDTTNWISIGKKYDVLFGSVCYDTTYSDGTVVPTGDAVTLRISKEDTTFNFQYIESGSSPQTFFSVSAPKLNDKNYSCLIGVDSTDVDATVLWDNFKIYKGIINNALSSEYVLYVDSRNGSDSSDGGPLSPLKNLFVATAWAKKDSVIVLYDGTYNPTEIVGKNLSIIGANGVQPSISTLGVQDTTGSNWENSCLTLRDFQGQIKNLKLHHANEAVSATDTRNLEISGCEICDSTIGVKCAEYTVNTDVVRNTFHTDCTGIVFDYQVYNPYVSSNIFYDMTTGVSISDASNYIINANTFDRFSKGVVVDQTSVGYVSSNNLTNMTLGIQIDNDSSVYVLNNNFYNTSTNYIGTGTILEDSCNIATFPYYYNSALRNYHILSNSPDRSSGTDIVDKYFIDRDGARRLVKPGYDIGAYIYASTDHGSGAYYVNTGDGTGDDYLNNGTLSRPYRTLDKALSVADSSIGIAQGWYDSYHLGLRNQSIFLVDTTNHTVSLNSHYSNINLANTLFVSPSGSDGTVMGGDGTDSGGNGSLQKPFRTITRALEVASVGSNIICLAGDYPVFTGAQNRTLIPYADKTGIGDGRLFIQDLFETPSTLYPGHIYPDSSNWTIDATSAVIHDGYLAMTYDKTNSVTVLSNFSFNADFEVTAEIQQAFDPMFFRISNTDTTVVFEYSNGDYTSNLYTAGDHAYCWGTLSSDTTERYFTDYICVNSQDIQNKYITLTYLVDDPLDVAMNIIGGSAQECDVDYYIQDNLVKWDGKGLDGAIQAGEILRIHYVARGLSAPARIQFVSSNGFLTVRGPYPDSTTGRLTKLMKRVLPADYTTNPWSVMFYMDTTGDYPGTFGRGYVSKFSAIAESFNNIEASPYEYKTYRQPIILY